MFDKQQDNLRTDQRLALEEQKAQQKHVIDIANARSLLTQREAAAQKALAETGRVPFQIQHDIASAQSALANAEASRASAALARDTIGTRGKEFTTVGNPKTGVFEKVLIDTKTGKPIATYGNAPPKDVGDKTKEIPESTIQKAYGDLEKSITHTDRDGKVKYKKVVPQIAIDKYNEIAEKSGMKKMRIVPITLEGIMGDTKVDLVTPVDGQLEDLYYNLINNHNFSSDDAAKALEPYRRK
jgi:hypothetical protein